MRASRLILLVPAVLACANADEARDDTTTAVATGARLMPGDVAGTWHGVSRGEQGDSVLLRWTSVYVTDTSGYSTAVGFTDTIPFRVQFHGDSMLTTSEPFPFAAAPNAPMQVYRATGRMRDGKLAGTLVNVLASNPDSIVSRERWEASRLQQ